MSEKIRTSSPYRGTSVPIEKVRYNITQLTGGRKVSIPELTAASPEEIPESPVDQFRLFVYGLYQPEDYVNVVRQAKSGTNGKMSPVGGGVSFLRDQWVANIRSQNLEGNKGGVWIRYNPVTPTGSGKLGAYTDADVTAYTYVLLEADDLDLETQATLLAHLNLPIVSIVSSGGRSLHALVKVTAANAAEYRDFGAKFFRHMAHFGVDCSNVNPSRMTRAPGATRPTPSGGSALQQLLYFNPDLKPEPIINKIS